MPTYISSNPSMKAANLAAMLGTIRENFAALFALSGGSLITVGNDSFQIVGAASKPVSNPVQQITVTAQGTGYTTAPVTISAPDLPGGTQATATATIVGGKVTGILLVEEGGGYTANPTVTIGGDGAGATATATYSRTVRLYYDTDDDTLYFSRNGGAYGTFPVLSNNNAWTGNQVFMPAASGNAPIRVNAATGHTGPLVRLQLNEVTMWDVDTTGTLTTGIVPWARLTGTPAIVNSFNGRSGAVSPELGDYDGFFLTSAEADAAYVNVSGDTMTGSLTTSGASSGIFSRGTSASHKNFFPWVSGDAIGTMFVGSSTAGNNQVALTAQSDSNIAVSAFSATNFAVQGVSTTGQAANFETGGASANPVVRIKAHSTHTGPLIRGLLDNSIKFEVNKDGHIGVASAASATVPLFISKAGVSTNQLALLRGPSSTDWAWIGIEAGDGTTSSRQTILRFAALETSPQTWHTGMRGSKPFVLYDQTNSRTVISASETTGVVDHPHGVSASRDAGNAVTGTSTSLAGIRGLSATGWGAIFTTTGASNQPVVELDTTSAHAGVLFRARFNAVTKFDVSKDGHTGIGTTAHASIPLFVSKNGVGTNALATLQGTNATDRAMIHLLAGDGTTSTRMIYQQFQASETAAHTYRVGLLGTKDWKVRDETNTRDVLAVSSTTGFVSFPQGAHLGSGAFSGSLPLEVRKTGHTTTPLAWLYAPTSTDRAIIDITAGDGTTSARHAYIVLRSNETTPARFHVGLFGNKDFTIRDSQNARSVLIASETTGVVDFPQGITTLNLKSTMHVEIAPQGAPAAPASGARLYVDSADGDLKVKFSNGSIVVLAVGP